MNPNLIRNFCIIAHIDHGKSTLADRFLELTKTVDNRQMEDRFLDSNPIAKERGITIKLAPVCMRYQFDNNTYNLNLIDTPGHVDFSYEVSRALAACEGAILLVDAVSGIQAQTLTVYRQAKAQNLKIIPVINKIDAPGAKIEKVTLDLCQSFNFQEKEILTVSAKTGQNVDSLLKKIIQSIPAPKNNLEKKSLKALVFDSKFSQHQGVIADIRIFQGQIETGKPLFLMAQKTKFTPVEIGIYHPSAQKQTMLSAGQAGYLATGLKSLTQVKVGDTVTTFEKPTQKPLSGYKEPKPMVFLGLYPTDNDDYEDLVKALEKLHLNDASFTYAPDFSTSLGKGFRVGFAGLLHAEIVQERLEREFDLNLIASVPNVIYQYEQNGKKIEIQTARELPDQVDKTYEPWLSVETFTPKDYLGSVMNLFEDRRGVFKDMKYLNEGVQLSYELPMSELITDFFDRLKSISSGYATLDYEYSGMRQVDAIRLDILIHNEKVDALSKIVVKSQADKEGREIVKKLKKVIPRQMFEVAIQAAIGGRILARETVRAFRKDVTAKLYGGDKTRRMKLLNKQKKGKKRMKQFGKIEIPQEAFLAVMKKD